jgi:hypothetical protein
VGAVEVIVMKIMREEGSALSAGVIGASIGPLASDGLDEAFRLAIGLRAIRSCEAVSDAEFVAGGGKDFGAISGAAIGEEALDADAVSGVEGDSLAEGVEGAGELFVWEQTGKGEATVIIDGDVERLDAGTGIAVGAITGGTDARACEAAQFLDVEVEEFARKVTFVALDGRLWRFERGEAIEAVAPEHAREGGLGDGEHHPDLSVGTAGTTKGDDLSFERRAGLARLALRSRRAIVKALRKARRAGASQPAANGLLTDAKSGGRVAQGEAELMVRESHLGSRERSQFGISVHVDRAGKRSVEYESTTSLPNPSGADNVLKHDT